MELKDKIILISLFVLFIVVLIGESIYDSRKEAKRYESYDIAIIELADGTTIEGEIEDIDLYTTGRLEITIDGETYFVDSENVTLIDKDKKK